MSERSLIAWNNARHSIVDVLRIQTAIGAGTDGRWGPATQKAVEQWQAANGLAASGKVDDATMTAMMAVVRPTAEEWRALTDAEIDGIIEHTITVEAAGKSNPYAAANRNAEWNGWFDRPKRDAEGRKLKPAERAKQPGHKPHKASRYGPTPSMIGLSHGPIQTTQDGGALGKVMRYWFEDEPDRLNDIFDGQAFEVVTMLTHEGRSGFRQSILRGPRVQPVGGHDLWSSHWMPCWNAAADELAYQRAQRRVMREDYMAPAIKICKDYGHASQGTLAVAFDCAVQYGGGGARSRFKQAGEGAAVFDVLDVIEKRGGKRAVERRIEILAECEPFVFYSDLAMC